MHLVCLGVMRRLLWLWRKGPLQGRISSRNLESISNLLVGLVGFIPGEFSRKPSFGHTGACPKLYIANVALEQVDHIKFLGVMLDNNLTFKKHVQYIGAKISKNIGILTKARKYLNKDTLITLYYSFIYPYLNYANIVWGSSNKTTLVPLVKLQKKAIRIISSATKTTSSGLLFSKYRILTIDELYTLNVGSFMHSFLTGKIPKPFQDMFTLNSNIHSYQTRQSSQFHTPVGRTTLSYRSIKFKGVSVYNKLSTKINTQCSTKTFKKHVKKLLLSGSVLR